MDEPRYAYVWLKKTFLASAKRHGGAGSSHNKKRLLKHEMLQQPFNYYYRKKWAKVITSYNDNHSSQNKLYFLLFRTKGG
jgi:hypothetical protein